MTVKGARQEAACPLNHYLCNDIFYWHLACQALELDDESRNETPR